MTNHTDLKSSIKVLLTLYVMLDQDYQALVYYTENLEEGSIGRSKANLPNKDFTIDGAIVDSLWFQIIIKSCSFLDEWDRILGVQNEPVNTEKLLLIKKVAAPARRAIKFWKDLKKFRNEITAHNFRDKNNIVTIDRMGDYDSPQNIIELSFLICFINRMINILCKNFSEEMPDLLDQSYSNILKESKNKQERDTKAESNFEDLKNRLEHVDAQINKHIWSIPRYDILTNLMKKKMKY